MDCPDCQQPLEEGARFCPSCGHALHGDPDGTAVLEAVAAPAPAPPPNSGDDGSSGDSPGSQGSQGRGSGEQAGSGPRGTLVPCPACGADNSAARVLCARCGVDLESGERPVAAPVVQRPGPAVDVAGEVDHPERRGNRTAMIVAIIIVVGAIVGVLVGLWIVDSDPPADATAPVFDPGVYTGEPQPLVVGGIGASSERPPAGEVTYDASNLVDDDITTAWSHDPSVEAAQDVDLVLRLADPGWVTALTFANGAQSDDLAFTADGRVLRLRLLHGGNAVAELQLLDQPGLQRVTLPEPLLLETIRLVVIEAVPGDTYDEVSLSEIVVTGHPAQGEDLTRAVSGDATDETAE